MIFYPIIYTRTDGCDFCYRAKPRNLHKVITSLVTEIIFEDHGAPLIKESRRIYYRTDDYLFWGIGIHNDRFVPQEISSAWSRPEFGRHLRGFWGGYMNTSDCNGESLEYAACSLLRVKNAVFCSLDDDLKSLSMKQPRVDSKEGETEFPAINYTGKTKYPFSARMQQHFVQPFWKETWPPREERGRFADGNIISNLPYDLRLFASNLCQERSHSKPSQIIQTNWTKADRMSDAEYDEEQEYQFWIDLFLSGEKKCVISNYPEVIRERLTPIVQSIPEPVILVDEQNNYRENYLEKKASQILFPQPGLDCEKKPSHHSKSKKKSLRNADIETNRSTKESWFKQGLGVLMRPLGWSYRKIFGWLPWGKRKHFSINTDEMASKDRFVKDIEPSDDFDPLEAQIERMKRMPDLKNRENQEDDGF